MKATPLAILLLAPALGLTDPADDDCARPAADGAAGSVEVVFALDTTGSMSGMIEAAKAGVWSIANSIAAARPTPEIRMGLLAYRDRGDAYVTRRSALTDDLDEVYHALMQLRADGGGDTPESVQQALHEAVTLFDWSIQARTLRLVYLVGDAPPHLDYGDDVPYSATCTVARTADIAINAVQCGIDEETRRIWKEIATCTGGVYLSLPQSGGSRAPSTPWDEQLAAHSRWLDRTVVPYGDSAARDALEERLERSRDIDEGAPAEALAERAAFRASSGEFRDLVDDVAEGRIRLEDVGDDRLPLEMRGISLDERRRLVQDKLEQRRGLQEEIRWLTERRRAAITERSSQRAFDHEVVASLQRQGRAKGIRYCD